MSEGRVFQPHRRLAMKLSAPGGMRIATALSNADAAMERMRESSSTVIDERIEQLTAHMASREESSVRVAFSDVSEIASLAGMHGLTPLQSAAQSLVGHLAAWLERQPLPPLGSLQPLSELFWETVSVHVEAMRMLRNPEIADHAEACAQVIAGLPRAAARARPIEPPAAIVDAD